MGIVFNLHRFGFDEFAIGQLINGDLPANDEERWRILDAPRYRIQSLLDAHLQAQRALRACRDSGAPFVLFLRSFAAEADSKREGLMVATNVNLRSNRFQQWLHDGLAGVGAPVIKLHGGSDAVMPVGEVATELSTHADNWQAVAAELIEAAAAIVVLIGDMSAGIRVELELIRGSGAAERCFVAVPAPRDPGLLASLADFPSVFVLRDDVYPAALRNALVRLVRAAATDRPLERTLAAPFSYLEPGFVTSEDFAATERRIWGDMRELRVLFEDTYWAALKAHDVQFEHFRFPGPWLVAHQLYGLAVATADFRAIHEALSYLSVLYVFRRADFALLIDPLTRQYDELGAHIYPGGPPDTESAFSATRDPLALPRKIAVAVQLYELADQAARTRGPSGANYLFQAALVCALHADDAEASDCTWVAGNIANDWAGAQAATDQHDWALVNYELSLALHRSLAGAQPGRYARNVSVTLNNLGALYFRRADHAAADACFTEALDLRRRQPPDGEWYLADLHTSLLNLGLLRVETGDYERARSLYGESLAVCERLVATEPAAIVELARQEAYMALCLARLPGAQGEAHEYAERAAGRLSRVSEVTPQAADQLMALLDEARRVAGMQNS